MSLENLSESQILAIANPMMDELMVASTAIDYEQHIKNFSQRAKAQLSKEWFEYICKQYQKEKGFFTQREYVVMFKRPNGVAIIWEQNFSKMRGEYVAQMLLIEQNGKFEIDHVMVF